MTQQELRNKLFPLIKTMLEKNAYIKGHGDQFRVVDGTHSPVQNITRQEMDILRLNNVVRREGLISVLNIQANPFTIPLDIKLK